MGTIFLISVENTMNNKNIFKKFKVPGIIWIEKNTRPLGHEAEKNCVKCQIPSVKLFSCFDNTGCIKIRNCSEKEIICTRCRPEKKLPWDRFTHFEVRTNIVHVIRQYIYSSNVVIEKRSLTKMKWRKLIINSCDFQPVKIY